MREIRTDAGGHAYEVPILADFVAAGRDLVIACFRPTCRRELRLTPQEAVALLGANCTIERADRRLVCSACGARGRDGFVQARFIPIAPTPSV